MAGSCPQLEHALPDVNHFVIARSKTRGTVMGESSGVLGDVLPDGTRRTASAAAADRLLNIQGIDEWTDCLIDCFVYFSEKPRGAVSWKAIRNDIALEIDKLRRRWTSPVVMHG